MLTRSTIAFGLVFLLHVLLLLMPKHTMPHKTPSLRTLPVALQLHEHAIASRSKANRKSPTQPSGGSVRATGEARRLPKPSEATIQRYGDLLPGLNSFHQPLDSQPSEGAGDLMRQHSFAAGSSGQARQDLKRDGGSLATLFDVPRKVRLIPIAREASLRLRYDAPSDRFQLVSLRGEALLRAVLYESLQEEGGRVILRRIFEQLGSHQLQIVLRISADGGDTDDEDASFFWQGERLVINKGFAFVKASNGLVLPDAEAERARLRDAAFLSRLQDSPAYRTPLGRRML